MNLRQKIILFQWFLGFLGAGVIFGLVSTAQTLATPPIVVEARTVQEYPVIIIPQRLETVKITD